MSGRGDGYLRAAIDDLVDIDPTVLREALYAVLDTHRPGKADPGYTPFCLGCWDGGAGPSAADWPCPTVQAITEKVTP